MAEYSVWLSSFYHFPLYAHNWSFSHFSFANCLIYGALLYQLIKTRRHDYLLIFFGISILVVGVILEAISHTINIATQDLSLHAFVIFCIFNTVALFIRARYHEREAAEKKILKDSLEAASIVQNKMFDTKTSCPFVKTFTKHVPAMDVGGDWSHQIYSPERQTLYLFVGDVTGHGAASTLVASAVLGIFSSNPEHEFPGRNDEYLSFLFSRINILCQLTGNRVGRWMSCFGVAIDFRNQICHYINAGHQPALLLSDKKYQFLRKPSPLVGEDYNSTFQTTSIPFQVDDELLIFTDGILENGGSKSSTMSLRTMKRTMESCKSFQERSKQIENWCHSSGEAHDDSSAVFLQVTSLPNSG